MTATNAHALQVKRWRLDVGYRKVNGRLVIDRPKMVPVEQARDHLFELIASGWTYRPLAEITGTSPSTLSAIRNGHMARVRRTTADAVLAVDPLSPVDHVVVDRLLAGLPVEFNPDERRAAIDLGTRRGMSAHELAAAVGLTPRHVVRTRSRLRAEVRSA